MRRGFVPTAAAKQAEADRRQRHFELMNGPMGLWDKVLGGHLAREFERSQEENVHMTVIDDLKAAMRQFTTEHEALAATLRKWTPGPRPPGTFDPDKPHLVALDGTDLGAFPPEHVERQRKAARSALQGAEARAAVELSRLLAEAAKVPTAQYQLGTKLSTDALTEVQLLTEQYRGLTKQEQADLVAQGQAALERGDLQAALTAKRAADVLHISAPDLDVALVEADPQRRAARVELDYLSKLAETWRADVTRRHVAVGMVADGETVKAVDDPHTLGMSADAGPYVTQAIGL